MSTKAQSQSPLAEAAAAFERELDQYEKLTGELKRTPVRSEKTLHRTKRLLNESAECEQRLSVLLQSMLVAMNGARDRQQACMDIALEAVQGVQTRAVEFQTLLERVSDLGQKAREVNEPVAQVMTEKMRGAKEPELRASLQAVSERMRSVIEQAETIARAAEDGDWPEIARDVRNLKQQVVSARGKVVDTCNKMDQGLAAGPAVFVDDGDDDKQERQ